MAAMLRDSLGIVISNEMVTTDVPGPMPRVGQDSHAPSSGVVLNEAKRRGDTELFGLTFGRTPNRWPK